MSIKELVYLTAKMTGCFALASRWTQGMLGILCYHGFSFRDEHRFRPQLFQTPESFEKRMRWLKRAGYRTLSLDEAARRLRGKSLGPKEIVITIDDGFYSVAALAAPILKSLDFTATVYVTTYYVLNSHPIFRIALQYLFWKTCKQTVECADLVPGGQAHGATKGVAGDRLVREITEFGETRLAEPERMSLLRALAQRLDVNFDELIASRRLGLLTPEEITDLARTGFDIQLHTHRHRLPTDHRDAKRELDDNRGVLAPLTGRPLNHLCYPSGVWSPVLWPVLEAEGVETGTTCDAGLNSFATPPLAWSRFLDFEQVPQIVFEAEVSGFAHLVRPAVRLWRQ
jgi:peptidoglycan/xylan/chitin deacetylase (PgdA/CDA1 family)